MSQETERDPEGGILPQGRDHTLTRSERAMLEHDIHTPKWLQWFEYPFRVKSDVSGKFLPEATGWAMDAAARGPLNLLASYVGLALLALASQQAGCAKISACEKTVYGLKPSSLLTTVTSVIGVVAALSMPVFGAIVDRTPYRRRVGVITACILIVTTAIQITVGTVDWLIILCIEAVAGLALVVHTTSVFAYLPDLANTDRDFIHYTANFNVRQLSAQTLFAVGVAIVGVLTKKTGDAVGNAVRTSIGASSIALAMAVVFFGYSWTFTFRNRPALHALQEGESLWTVGFTSVFKTSREVFQKYNSLKWFLVTLLWSPEAGTGVISSITVTYLQVVVQMTPSEVSYVLVILLASNVPGSIISKFACNRLNPLNSYRLAVSCFIVASSLFTLVDGPSKKKWAYVFALVWGVCFGWIYPSQRALFCGLIPKGKEFEFMGIFVFFGSIIGWLPTLLFTVLNERGVDMRVGLALLPIFFFLALACTVCIGDYNEAVKLVSEIYTMDDKEEAPIPKESDFPVEEGAVPPETSAK
jgi:MFS transporter, UMF1 family